LTVNKTYLETAIATNMDLGIDERTVLFDEFISVARVAMLMVITIRGSTIGKEDHDLVDRLGVLREVIPEHVCILQVGLRVPLLGVDEVGELGRVPNEEHRGVVEDPVKVALARLQLNGKSTGVTGGIRRAILAAHGGETNGCANLFAD
jgi:hypothetical protein